MGSLAKNSNITQDKTADSLLAIGVGFLINLILGAGLPQAGPFIAGLVAGGIVENGPHRGASARFLSGPLGELGSIALWVLTNLLSLPVALLPYAWDTAFAIITAVSAVLALSGGITGSDVSLQQWSTIHDFLLRHHMSLPFIHHTGQVKIQEE